MAHQQLTIHIRVDLVAARLLAVGLVLVALTGSTAWAKGEPRAAAVPAAQTTTLRGYYITPSASYDGDEALTACKAPGYHMASLWELWDVTNLAYNRTWGFAAADGEYGPPTNLTGWIRTGYHSPNGDPSSPGVANCQVWLSASPNDYGTVAYIAANWTAADSVISPWAAVAVQDSCDTLRRVWCVED